MDEQLPSMPYSGAVAKDRCPVCRATFDTRDELLSHLEFSDCRAGHPVPVARGSSPRSQSASALPRATNSSPPPEAVSPRTAIGSKILKLISPRRTSVADSSPPTQSRGSGLSVSFNSSDSLPAVPVKKGSDLFYGGVGESVLATDVLELASSSDRMELHVKEGGSPRKDGGGSPRKDGVSPRKSNSRASLVRVKKSGSGIK
jgi:hypothetical protein